MAKYEALPYSKRRAIVKHLKKGKLQKEIAVQLNLKPDQVSKYLDFYKKQKIIDWRKFCRFCENWKPATEEYFKKSCNYRKDWSVILYSKCKACNSRMLKNEVILQSDKVKRAYEVRKIRRKRLIAEWKWKFDRLEDLTPEQVEKRKAYRTKYNEIRKKKRKLKSLTKKEWLKNKLI